jgi:hypothetical protein
MHRPGSSCTGHRVPTVTSRIQVTRYGTRYRSLHIRGTDHSIHTGKNNYIYVSLGRKSSCTGYGSPYTGTNHIDYHAHGTNIYCRKQHTDYYLQGTDNNVIKRIQTFIYIYRVHIITNMTRFIIFSTYHLCRVNTIICVQSTDYPEWGTEAYVLDTNY